MVKLGKKLEVTDIKERMKLLIDGEVFYTETGCKLSFNVNSAVSGNSSFRTVTTTNQDCAIQQFWSWDWYYPAKTYTINGVELVDERVSADDAHKLNCEWVYISSSCCDAGVKEIPLERTNIHYLEWVAERSLLFLTRHNAEEHTKAMIKVTS